MAQQKILVIDDEKLISDLILQALQVEGYDNVKSAANGREGLEKYMDFLPDLVIMDVDMPIMDGYESSSKIKSFDPGAKILVITGDPSDLRAHRIIDEGLALTLLHKPVPLRDLTRKIKENLPTYN